MSASKSNRQVICEVLMEQASGNPDLCVVCSDSRGSASLAPFASAYPGQFVEVGIAEQNLVGISAGLAAGGMKVFAASPASFVSTRSYEQAKVDVAYAQTDVKLIGISGGISYGALGMTHHSTQDFAAMTALSGMRVYCPSDQYQTRKLIEALLDDDKPAYIRVSRSASKDLYSPEMDFTLNQANILKTGKDVLLVACGEMTSKACEAAALLGEAGIDAGVLDMYCLKPFDEKTLLELARDVKLVVSVEEHSQYGGLGSQVAQSLCHHDPKRLVELNLPDEHLISGSAPEMYAYYGLDGQGIARSVLEALG